MNKCVVFSILIIFFLMLFPHSMFSQDSRSGDIAQILVLPFTNLNENSSQQYLSTSIKDSIEIVLNKEDIIKIIFYEDVKKKLTENNVNIHKLTNMDTILKIGKLSNSGYIIAGEFFSGTRGLTIRSKVYNTTSGQIILELNTEGAASIEVFDVVDAISAGLIVNLSVFIKHTEYHQYDYTPSFFWRAISGANKYELYIDNKKIYSGTQTQYTITEPLSAGEHKYFTITYVGNQNISTQPIPFIIEELKKPVILTKPEAKTYNQMPTVECQELDGIKEFKIYVNDTLYQTSAQGKIVFESPLDFGEHTIRIVGSNPHQEKSSDPFRFEVLELKPSHLIFPEDQKEIFSDINPVVAFSWENECKEAKYRIFVDDQLVSSTEDTSYAMSGIDRRGSFTWYVEAEMATQKVQSPIQTFYYTDPLLKVGARVEAASVLASNFDTTYSWHNRYEFTAEWFPYHEEWFPFHFLSLETGLSLGMVFIEFDGVPFHFPSSEVKINYSYLSIPVLLKPRYGFGLINLAMPIGIAFDILSSAMIKSGDNSYNIKNELRQMSNSFIIGLESSYVFSEWLEVSFNIRYELGLASLTKNQYFNEKKDHRFGFGLGLNIYRL